MYMNDLIKTNGPALTGRTPTLIAAEINDIKGQTRKMVLYNSIEIGRRLVEAKSLLSHGDWGGWLENSVDYSQSTAENLMRIFDEYGADQITLLTDNAKSQALGNLSYTQAVALLGVSENEREQFIKDNDIDTMSTRELQQAIKDLKQAREEKEMVAKEKELLESELGKVQDSKKEAEDKVKSLAVEKDKMKKDLDAAKKKTDEDLLKKNRELEKSKKDLEKLNVKIKELESKPLDVNKGATDEDIEKIKTETAEKYEKDLALLKVEKEQAEKKVKDLEVKATKLSNAAALKYSVYFDLLVKNFSELLGALAEIKETDDAAHDRYRNAIAGLIGKMSERL